MTYTSTGSAFRDSINRSNRTESPRQHIVIRKWHMRYPVKWASRLTSIRFLYASTVSLSSRLACKHKFSILKDVMRSPDIATLNTHFRLGISRYTYVPQCVCLAIHCLVGQSASCWLIPIVPSSGSLLLLLIVWLNLFYVASFHCWSHWNRLQYTFLWLCFLVFFFLTLSWYSSTKTLISRVLLWAWMPSPLSDSFRWLGERIEAINASHLLFSG